MDYQTYAGSNAQAGTRNSDLRVFTGPLGECKGAAKVLVSIGERRAYDWAEVWDRGRRVCRYTRGHELGSYYAQQEGDE